VTAKGLIRALLVVTLACLAVVIGTLLFGYGSLGIWKALSPATSPWTGPLPRDVSSPDGLSPEVAATRIWWQGRYRYLDGTLVFPNLSQDPHWGRLSPSGKHFVGLTGGFNQIEWMNVETGQQRVLADSRYLPGGPALGLPRFTPDERAVVFDVCWSDRCHVAIVDVASGEIAHIPLGRTMNKNPLVSPDGQWILVECEGRFPRSFWALCLIDWEAHIRSFLTDDEGFNPAFAGSEFTPDSQWVVYPAWHVSMPAWRVPREEGRIYRVSIDGVEKYLLLSGVSAATEVMAVTSDDVVFSCRFSNEPRCDWVCVMGLDGSDVRRLAYLGESCLPEED